MIIKRLFIALDIPENVKNYLFGICQNFVRDNLFKGRCVPVEQLHLTLKFIGDIDEDRVLLIEHALSQVVYSPFHVTTGSVCFFKIGKIIKILYADLLSSHLAGLAYAIDNALAPHVPLEKRPFVAHVTLARITAVPDRERFLETMNCIENEQLHFIVNEFVLKESLLSPQGAEHRVLATYQLK